MLRNFYYIFSGLKFHLNWWRGYILHASDNRITELEIMRLEARGVFIIFSLMIVFSVKRN